MNPIRFIILGAGAVGSYFGARLSKHYDVVLLGNGEHLAAIEQKGLRITGASRMTARPAIAYAPSDLPPSEARTVVLVTVKSHATAAAVGGLVPYVQNALFLSLQNGIGNEAAIAAQVGAENTMGGVTFGGYTFVRPGTVNHAGFGETLIGELDGRRTQRVRDIAGAFTAAGMPTTLSRSIDREIWAKTIINCSINAITAITGKKNGAVSEQPELRALSAAACTEAVAVARAHGVMLTGPALIKKTLEVAKKTAENRSSMLQDIEAGRKTEIAAINGMIVALGAQHGVPTPVNATLAALVASLEPATSFSHRL